jgi:hypothetical protein
MLEKELKDTYKYLHNDTATKVDSLGFRPYVEAIAEFLTDENTHSPLTLSIEGTWGSGKSSFMKQLEDEIKKLNFKKKVFTVCFNPWRFDKEDELWAAFALSLTEQLSKKLSWKDRQYAKINLLWQRINIKYKSDSSFVIDIFWRFFCLFLILLSWLWIYSHSENITDTLFSHLTDDTNAKIIYNKLIILTASIGLLGSIFSILKNSKLLANPFDFIKSVQDSNYKERLPFIENFHSDFVEIIKSYAGKSRVYVFIDDLDRCETSKAAELMKAINLMISDNPNIYFIIGMDRKLIAAGIASCQNEVFSNLTDDKLKYGYEFIEKFIQFPFKVPKPKNIEYKEFLFGKDDSKEQTEKIRKFVLGEKNSKESTEEKINVMDLFSGTDCYELSENFVNIMKMVSPALDNNPRRLKQFHNLFRFYKYIGRRTGLFFRKGEKYNVWNCKKLGKFIAISMLWPDLVFTLSLKRKLMDNWQSFALGLGTEDIKSKYTFWEDNDSNQGKYILEGRLIELLREGCIDGGNVPKDVDEYTLSNLDYSKLLDISPIGSYTVTKHHFIRSTSFIVGSASVNAEVSQANDEGKHNPNVSSTDNQTAKPTILPLSSHVSSIGSSTANIELLRMDGDNDINDDENKG